MQCPACGVRVVANSVYCLRCGARVSVEGEQERSPNPRRERSRRAFDVADPFDDEERLLWQGTFSWKGMLHEFLAATLASVVLVVGGNNLQLDTVLWLYTVALLASLWLLLLALLVYRKLNVYYRVTNQRLIHERGIFYRIVDRIEVIDIDDVRVEQSIVERLFGVGRIRLCSSDRTDPTAVLKGLDRVRHVSDIIDDARRKERIQRGLHVEAV